MIEVEKLTRYFGNITAIEDVTFKVEKGEVLGFLGPNAAGKTTTMRILTCFLPASKGTAKVANFDVFQSSLEVKQRIGYLPENLPLNSEMTVYSFLDFIAKIKGIDPRDRKQKITNAYFHFQGNGDLFLNVFSWLAEQGDLISIRAGEPEDNRISLTAQQSRVIFWIGVVLLPLSILIAGIVIYIQRK